MKILFFQSMKWNDRAKPYDIYFIYSFIIYFIYKKQPTTDWQPKKPDLWQIDSQPMTDWQPQDVGLFLTAKHKGLFRRSPLSCRSILDLRQIDSQI